jgi:hypothetical protein
MLGEDDGRPRNAKPDDSSNTEEAQAPASAETCPAADERGDDGLEYEQEEVLIHRINLLTDRGMPPTCHSVKNLVEEIRGQPVSKN